MQIFPFKAVLLRAVTDSLRHCPKVVFYPLAKNITRINKSALTSPRIKRPRQLTIQQRLLYFSLLYSQVGSLPEVKKATNY